MFEHCLFSGKRMLAIFIAAAVLFTVSGACMSISSKEASNILHGVADAMESSDEEGQQVQQAGQEESAGGEEQALEGEEAAANEQAGAQSTGSEDANKQVGPPLPLEAAVQYVVSQPLEKGAAACYVQPIVSQGQVPVPQMAAPAIQAPAAEAGSGGVAIDTNETVAAGACFQYQNKIVFSRLDASQPNAHYELYLVDPDGSNLTRIPVSQDYASDATVRDYQHPSWSPNRCQIAFTGHTIEGGNPNADIYTIKPDGTGMKRLTNSPAAEQDPDWFADGETLVYTSNQAYLPADPDKADLYTVKADGSSPAVLLSADNLVYEPQMFPGLKYVAYTWNLKNDSGEMYTSAWIMNIEKQKLTRLTPEDGFHYRYPSWSKDGSKLAVATNAFMERYQLAVMKPDGSDIRHVVLNIQEDEVVRAIWSLDCQKMLVEIGKRRGGRSLLRPACAGPEHFGNHLAHKNEAG